MTLTKEVQLVVIDDDNAGILCGPEVDASSFENLVRSLLRHGPLRYSDLAHPTWIVCPDMASEVQDGALGVDNLDSLVRG